MFPSSSQQPFLDPKNVPGGCSAAIIYSKYCQVLFREHTAIRENKERKREKFPPVNTPVIPQSQQCFNLLCHLIYHLNVLRPSNMNHEYMHPGVGQHSLLEYITSAPGDHFVHPSKMYHISNVERDMTSCVLWCKYYYNSWNSNTYGRAINLNHKRLGRDLLRVVTPLKELGGRQRFD